jgi:hypothetical protein
MEDVEHARFRASAQIMFDKEHGGEAFEEYLEVAFPGRTARRRAGEKDAQKLLAEEVGKVGKGFKVTALPEPTLRSKLGKQVRRVTRE